MRTNPKLLQRVLGGDEDEAAQRAWEANLSLKRYKNLYGQATSMDPGMQEGCFEWVRKVRRNG